ncbi:MAG: Prolyl oligopeptidase family protein [Gemmataceae bacterium]|nr:Prolyl oligopeptidase family protein [Gemmataceae bacterium]
MLPPSSLRRLVAPALLFALAAVAVGSTRADGPGDNIPDKVRPVPPAGIELPPADAEEIARGLAELQGLIKDIGRHELLPDVEVYEKAVRYAVAYKEVFDAKGIPAVKTVLKTGLERARQLKDGKTPWATATGLVVRGYRSKIDGSAQPYGLVIPKEYDFQGGKKHRLDFWWHGRGETLSEVNFIDGRQKSAGEFTPDGALVLHPYGRYCNANKFAGEIDTLECLDHAKKHYRIDDSRVVARGFSMGGAACWQFAVHYPTLFCAAAPGAGFSETPDFLKVFQKEEVSPPWYEQKLWHVYNATDTARNLFNLPTVAYSGEVDSQRQAAVMMEKALKAEGMDLVHLIGPKTGHSYEKTAKAELNKRIDAIVEKGRDPLPKEIRFVTYTLRYNQSGWLTVEGLEKHWARAEVEGKLDNDSFSIKTTGVTALAVACPSGSFKGSIDGKDLILIRPKVASKPYTVHFRKTDGKWDVVRGNGATALAKKPGLQGPIDDAFMDSFVMVAPSGKPLNEKVGKWVDAEMKHAVEHWRNQFRGDAPVKSDAQITRADARANNLVLWGDPDSNAVLAMIAEKLPIKWTSDGVTVGGQTYPAGTHVPVLIYPNPLNPKKYVVINSGFTFREYDYLNNARQVPKLPDYAVIDIATPPNARYPGRVVQAGFFGEKWELLPEDGK